MKRRNDGVPLRTKDTDTLPDLLRDVYMSEDWGDGYIKIHNTRLDEDIYIEIYPSHFWCNSDEVRDLIHKFCKDLARLSDESEDNYNAIKKS